MKISRPSFRFSRPKLKVVLPRRMRFMESQLTGVKAFFLSRLFREKILLLGFVLIVAATWLSSVIGRTNKLVREVRMTEYELQVQKGWLEQQTAIEAAAKAAIEHLDPAKTYDGGRLQAEIDAIARRTKVGSIAAENVQTEHSSQFSMNSMQVTIRNVDWNSLTEFYKEIVNQTPYIGITQCRIIASNNKHNVSLRITSPEIAK